MLHTVYYMHAAYIQSSYESYDMYIAYIVYLWSGPMGIAAYDRLA